MAKRTYLPTLVIIGKALIVYVTRNRAKIERGLQPHDVSPLLDALLTALQGLIELAETEVNP